jgi:ferritin-like metal-binding protein YciE
MNRQGLQELFVDQLQSLYDAEKQLTNTLSKLVEAADSEELPAGLTRTWRKRRATLRDSRKSSRRLGSRRQRGCATLSGV